MQTATLRDDSTMRDLSERMSREKKTARLAPAPTAGDRAEMAEWQTEATDYPPDDYERALELGLSWGSAGCYRI